MRVSSPLPSSTLCPSDLRVLSPVPKSRSRFTRTAHAHAHAHAHTHAHPMPMPMPLPANATAVRANPLLYLIGLVMAALAGAWVLTGTIALLGVVEKLAWEWYQVDCVCLD